MDIKLGIFYQRQWIENFYKKYTKQTVSRK